jgi:hypothetical protein
MRQEGIKDGCSEHVIDEGFGDGSNDSALLGFELEIHDGLNGMFGDGCRNGIKDGWL